MEAYLSQFLMFLATIDPVGTLALFVGLTAAVSPKDRRRIAFRSVGYSALVLVTFIIVGQILLGSLGIRLAAFELSGGIIFFLFGVGDFSPVIRTTASGERERICEGPARAW